MPVSEFEHDFMVMDHDAFVSKYAAAETEIIPRKYLKPDTHSYFDEEPLACATCGL